jgi:hypothetical protein
VNLFLLAVRASRIFENDVFQLVGLVEFDHDVHMTFRLGKAQAHANAQRTVTTESWHTSDQQKSAN